MREHSLMHTARENAAFLLCALIFLLAGGLALWQLEKGSLVLFFSGCRSFWGDEFFRLITHLGEFFGYISVFLVLLGWRLRYALGTLALGLATMLSAGLLKQVFRYPRPLTYFAELGRAGELELVEGVEVHAHLSFPSGHTMGAFALFTYLALALPRKGWAGPLCFGLALAVGLSRIYLVQHFLEDVYFGAVLGILLGMTAYLLSRPATGSSATWLDRSLAALFQKKGEVKT